MKKLVTLMMSILLVVGLLSACSSNKGVMTVDKYDVTAGEATFVLRELEAMYESQYGETIWETGYEGKTFDEIAKEAAIDSIKRLYVSKLVADERGITLTEEDQTAIETQMTDYLTYKSEEELKADGITMDDVKSIFNLNAIAGKLMEMELENFEVDQEALDASLANDESYQQILKYGYEGVLEQVTAQHILISTANEDGSEMSEDDKAAAKEEAEMVLGRVLAGDAFDGLVADYSDDPSWVENGGIYTFYRGEMVGPFEEAAFSMEIGGISDLVETDFGFHIIKVTDHTYPDEEQVQNVKDYESYLISQYEVSQQQGEYDVYFAEWEANYTIEVNEKNWEKVLTTHQKKASTEESTETPEESTQESTEETTETPAE